jgi:hypothetical protein
MNVEPDFATEPEGPSDTPDSSLWPFVRGDERFEPLPPGRYRHHHQSGWTLVSTNLILCIRRGPTGIRWLILEHRNWGTLLRFYIKPLERVLKGLGRLW